MPYADPEKRRAYEASSARRKKARIFDKNRYADNRAAVLLRRKEFRKKNLAAHQARARTRYCPIKSRMFQLQHKYGISVQQYDSMMQLQGGVCAICKNPPKTRRLAVDHAHDETKRVRGLLCHVCNKYRVGMNTAETARKVLEYVGSSFDGRSLG